MNILIVGPAGSGKSLLTSSFGKYLELNYSVRYVNLDAGAVQLPYEPDYDVREAYTLDQIMSQMELGPNGATLEAVDRLKELEMPRYDEDFILFDTPGQLEPFVFRGGAEVFRSFADGSIYLFDGTAPLKTFPSQYLYSIATQYALNQPMVRVLNKIDLIDREKMEELERMMSDPRMFRGVEDFGMRSQMNVDIADLLIEMYTPSKFPSVSAETQKGFENLAAYLIETMRNKENIGPEYDTPDEPR